MDFANRGNRPAQAQQQPASTENEQQSSDFKPMTPKHDKKSHGEFAFGKFSSVAMLFTGALLVLAVVLALIFGSDGNMNKEQDLILQDKYQAVFLDSQDGQVYFGKLDVYNESLYVLNDIYYVRVENPIQPEIADQQAQQPNISLAKLGNELHGPQDFMFISRDKVLYWENLKDDGQVVTAITNFKANGSTTDNNATQPAGTPQQNDTPATEPDETP